jgi:Flp pilus assembly protein TadD
MTACCAFLAAARPAQGQKTLPEQRWWKVEHADVTTFCNIGPMATEKYAKRLNHIAAGVATVVPRSDLRDGKPLHCFVVKSSEDLEYVRPGRTENVAGYYRPESFAHLLVVCDGAPDAHHTLNHEFVHAYFVPRLPPEPIWLHEGLAEYYSVIEVKSGKAVLGKPISHHMDVLEWLPAMDFIYMSQLSREQFVAMEPEKHAVFYAQSWALTHYLFEGWRTHPRSMGEFLQRLASGQTLTASLETSYGRSREGIDKGFRKYVDQAHYAYRKVALPEEFATGWKPKAERMNRDEILLRVSELGLDSQEARERTLPLLRETVELDVDNHEAARLLAVCLARQDSTAEALEWFERAIELGPDDGISHALLALILLRDEPDAETLERAGAHLRTAAAQIPGNVGVQIPLARVLLATGARDSAFVAYEAGLSVQPWHVQVMEEYIVARARVGQFAEAREILDSRFMPFASERRLEWVESRLADHYEVRFDELERNEGEASAQAFLVEAIEATHSPEVRGRLARRLQVPR